MQQKQVFNVGLSSYGKKVHKYIPVIFENTLNTSINIESVNKTIPPIITGNLSDENHKHSDLSNIKVSFIRMSNTYLSKEAINTSKIIYEDEAEIKESIIINDAPNNIVYDYCYTDSDGKYTVFLESGEYKVRLDLANKSEYINFSVAENEGLYNYYEYATDAYIKKKIDDTIQLYGTDKIQITGCLFNEYNKPYEGEIIISQDDKLIARIKTDSSGNYTFLLKYGIYDIRLRSPRQSVQIFYNFHFTEGKGFFTELLRHNIRGLNEEVLNNLLINKQLTTNILAYNWTSRLR